MRIVFPSLDTFILFVASLCSFRRESLYFYSILIMAMMHDENDDEVQGKSVLLLHNHEQSLFHLLTCCIFR